jgi:hypothetical protein
MIQVFLKRVILKNTSNFTVNAVIWLKMIFTFHPFVIYDNESKKPHQHKLSQPYQLMRFQEDRQPHTKRTDK